MTTSPYRYVLSTAQEKLNASIEQIRRTIPHSGEMGMLIEQQFRSQLGQILPEKVGISHGFVVDSSGSVSKQLDIILYDRLNTPLIFSSDGTQMFPVEATYACGEIKTNLNSAELDNCFDKCSSYKNLRRKAYFERQSPIKTTHNLFGRSYDHWQSIFFCIAYRSIKAESLLNTYNEIVRSKNLQVSKRVDTIIALSAIDKRNMLINISGELVNGVPAPRSIDLLPSSGSKLYSYPAKEPWSLFIMLLRYMNQVPMEPINMLCYSGEEPF